MKIREPNPEELHYTIDGVEMRFDPKQSIACDCVFCPGTLVFGVTEGGGYGAVHSVPWCEKFDRLDPLDFITETQQTYEKETGQSFPN